MAGTLTISTLSDGTNSTSATNCIKGSARAWVTYNGTTQTVDSSYNVSSVTYGGTGIYTVNFTNAFSNANYCVVVSSSPGNATSGGVTVISGPYSRSTTTTTTCRIDSAKVNTAVSVSVDQVYVSFFA